EEMMVAEVNKTDKEFGPADVEAIVARGREQGSLTYDELNEALSGFALDPDEIEELLHTLSDEGISVVRHASETKSPEDDAPEDTRSAETAIEAMDRVPIDDPVRMWLKEAAKGRLLNHPQEVEL